MHRIQQLKRLPLKKRKVLNRQIRRSPRKRRNHLVTLDRRPLHQLRPQQKAKKLKLPSHQLLVKKRLKMLNLLMQIMNQVRMKKENLQNHNMTKREI
jgi:hypothetical protein